MSYSLRNGFPVLVFNARTFARVSGFTFFGFIIYPIKHGNRFYLYASFPFGFHLTALSFNNVSFRTGTRYLPYSQPGSGVAAMSLGPHTTSQTRNSVVHLFYA